MNFKECISMNYEDKIRYICNNEYRCFFNKPNVIAIGYGNKIKDGFLTGRKCIKVFVINKVPKDKLLSSEVLPIQYKGIDIDVVESGESIPYGLKGRIRPLPGGYSVGPSKFVGGGTMTCMVWDNKGYYILGCNHVLAVDNKMPIRTEILQPAITDGGQYPMDTVANLYKYVPLKFQSSSHMEENYVDCAIAKIYDMSLVSNKIAILGKIEGIVKPSLDLSVRKVGKTTDVTYGYITTLHVTEKINTTSTQTLIYKEQIKTTSMAQAGDSGGILMDINNNAVGMVLGGNEKSTTCTPINNILNSLNVKIFN